MDDFVPYVEVIEERRVIPFQYCSVVRTDEKAMEKEKEGKEKMKNETKKVAIHPPTTVQTRIRSTFATAKHPPPCQGIKPKEKRHFSDKAVQSFVPMQDYHLMTGESPSRRKVKTVRVRKLRFYLSQIEERASVDNEKALKLAENRIKSIIKQRELYLRPIDARQKIQLASAARRCGKKKFHEIRSAIFDTHFHISENW